MKAALTFLFLLQGSVTAFVAGLWFLDAWLSDGRTTAFAPLPGYWNVTFDSAGAVLNLTYGALILSFIFGAVFAFALGYSLGREGRK